VCEIRLARIGDAFGGHPGEDVGDLLIGHWIRGHRLWDVVAPVGHFFVGAACNHDAAQVLVADERKILRIDNGAELALAGVGISIGGSTLAICTVTSGTENAVSLKSMLGISG